MNSNNRRSGKFSRDFSPGRGRNNKKGPISSERQKRSGNSSDQKFSEKTSKYFGRRNQNNIDAISERSKKNKNRRFDSESKDFKPHHWRSNDSANNSTPWKESEKYKERNNLGKLSRKSQRSFNENQLLVDRSDQQVVFQNESDDIVWGKHSTYSILESGRPIHRIWCTSEIKSSSKFFQLLKDVKALGVLVEEVSWARLGHVTGGGVHQGIALQKAASDTFDLKTMIDGCRAIEESPILIALDGLTDPQNLGAIVRSAEALGAHGMILPQRRSSGLTGTVAKAAAGALEHLPVARVVNLNRSLDQLKEEGYTILGLAGEGDKTVGEISFSGPLALVVGSEGKGLSLLTRRHCDQLIRIPLRGVTPSLNASVATSLLLYEIARQGWMKELSGQAPSPKLVRAKLKTQPIQDF